ncbi:cytochrome-c oxidase, cbb3-type subunit III [Silanimonas algicola]
MSDFWSWFLIALVVLNLVGCVWLLWYTSKQRNSSLPTGETTGHVWDGNITEYNKPLPRWWINLFYLTIAFTIGYFVVYPGFGKAEGAFGWSSQKQHDAEKAKADAAFAERYARFATMPIAEIARSPEALAVGRNLFANNCAQCHGSDGRGARGFPNLTDTVWQWGKDEATMLATINHGRIGVMPALGAAIGDDAAVTAVATYVQSLSGTSVDPALASVGKAKFDLVCAACHGVDGKGNPALGAPNLTDTDWLYAPDLATIREGIIKGRNGQMPAFEPVLGADRVRLVAAYVHSLSGEPELASTPAQAPAPAPAPAPAEAAAADAAAPTATSEG